MHKGQETTVIGKSYHASYEKIWHMLRYMDDDSYTIKCTLECAESHTQMIESISALEVKDFGEKTQEQETPDSQVYVQGLEDRLKWAYENFTIDFEE
jgi:hypothetical protein